MKPLLLLDKVTVQFGGLKAVSDVTFQVGERELFGLIGPNGAGKTTVFNAITGVYRPTEGASLSTGSQWPEKSRMRSPRAALRGRSRTSGSSAR